MKKQWIGMTGMLAVAVMVASVLAGCGKKNDSSGPMERTGAAMDEAAAKTAETTRDATDKTVEASADALKKAGAAVERTGENLQK